MRLAKKIMLFAAVAAMMMGAGAYAPAKSPLMTEWGETMTPENIWREYPRPQMVRDNWTCLNGEWDYAVTAITNTVGRPNVQAPGIVWDSETCSGVIVEGNRVE